LLLRSGSSQGSGSSRRSPRRLALDVLRAVWRSDAHRFAQDMIEERLGLLRNAADRRLFGDLVYGVIRRRGTLDAVLAAYASRPLEEVDRAVLDILRLGLYQILFHERVPAHAAVDEAVRLTRSVGRPAAASFVNAVLRTISAGIRFTEAPDPSRPLASLTLRVGRACVFDRAVLPPPEDRVAHLAALYSYPTWLIERWLARYGAERARELCEVCNEPPALFARPNSLRTDVPGLLARLTEEGVAAEPAAGGRTIRLPPHTRVKDVRSFREGMFLIQDDSSARVAPFLDPHPGERVLDLCAAPGGKSCHVAELMRNRGVIVAVDIEGTRLKRVVENALRLGIGIVATVEAEGAEFARSHAGEFDRVLVDAPCSNTGVLRRRVEARWRLSDAVLERLTRTQRALLAGGLRALRPGGVLVYSTCSLEPEENRELVRAVLAANAGFRLDAEERILPSREGGDGITMTRIVRAGGETRP